MPAFAGGRLVSDFWVLNVEEITFNATQTERGSAYRDPFAESDFGARRTVRIGHSSQSVPDAIFILGPRTNPAMAPGARPVVRWRVRCRSGSLGSAIRCGCITEKAYAEMREVYA